MQRIGELRSSTPLLQRAHLVLASIMHYYVHSLPASDAAVIPRSVATPLLEVSRELQIAPALTFADTVLWNWELIDPSRPLSVANMRYINVFSGTDTESNFYLGSAAVELKGVQMLTIFERFMRLEDAPDDGAIANLSEDLHQLAGIIDELTSIFQSMRDTVDPYTFYWLVRPWWSGSTSSQTGWILEGVANSSKLDLGGPSAGQSSVMHALDIFLDIDHELRDSRIPAPSPHNKRADRTFMSRMRRYMPGPHRQYLENLRSVRALAMRTPEIWKPYNGAVAALKNLRDLHIRIVALYVVTKANSSPPSHFRSPEDDEALPERQGPARGTGGSEVSNLLKAGRDATHRALLL